jgi:hypothetical protein
VVDNPHPNSKVNENGRRYNNKAESSHSMGLADRAMHGVLPQPFLKTPCTADSYTDKMKSKGVSGTSGTLAQEVVNGYAAEHRGLILPTPTAIEGVKWTNTWNPNSQMGQSLSAMAGSGMLPTPYDWKLNGGMLPTPRTMEVVEKPEAQANRLKDRTGNQMNNIQSAAAFGMLDPMTPDSLKTASQDKNAGKTSRLSPLFTEEMMGFPLMWTALPFLSENGAPKPSKPTATPSSHKSCTKSSEPSSK